MRNQFLPALFVIAFAAGTRADEYDRLTVGEQPDGRIVVPTNQILEPAGIQAVFPGRPVDLAFAENGKALVIMLADVDRSSFAVTAPSGPGTFDVFNPAGTFGIPPAHLAVVRFGVNESCAEVPEQSAVATSGAVKLTSVSATGYAGTYTIGLETGEQITGEFHTASCPGLATYLATPTHSCGG